MIVRRVVAAALAGAVAGVVVALVGNRWAQASAPTEYGFYAYSPLQNSIAATPAGPGTQWGHLLLPSALVGAVIGVAALLVMRRRGRAGGPRGARVVLASGTAGLVLGLAVGGALTLLAHPFGDAGQPRRYVDYLTTDGGPAYENTLSITFDHDPSTVWVFLGICAGTGLTVGLLIAGVITIARRRGIPRGTAGAA